MAQRMQKKRSELEKPKAMFTAAVAMRPVANSNRGEVRAPSTPDTNLDIPASQLVLSDMCPTNMDSKQCLHRTCQ
jgi:hypothetical protein